MFVNPRVWFKDDYNHDILQVFTKISHPIFNPSSAAAYSIICHLANFVQRLALETAGNVILLGLLDAGRGKQRARDLAL